MAQENVRREAVIDLGTNTFNLLIAEVKDGELNIIYNDKLPVLLGMGGINRGVIVDSAMERAKDALQRFYSSCREYNVATITGIGTSALRAASNAQELVDYAKRELDFTLEIVSGEREAELIYKGVKLSYTFSSPGVIMDIGGGSTEFIGADRSGIQWATSLDIGVSRIFQQLDQPEEFTKEHIQKIRAFLDEKGGAYFKERKSDLLIGASGSFETLYEMVFLSEFPRTKKVVEIPFEQLVSALDWGMNSSLKERMDNTWIIPIRKKMLPIAAVKAKWVIEQLGVEQVCVSPYSLKEGVFSREI